MQNRRVIAGAITALLITVFAGQRAQADDGFINLFDNFDSALGAEIVSFDPVGNQVFNTHSGGVEVIGFTPGVGFGGSMNIDLTGLALPGGGTFDGTNSVAVDPLGRGFAVAAVSPGDEQNETGGAVFINTATKTVITTLETGFLPDMVTFTPDGQSILVANEGEPGVDGTDTFVDPVGGVTKIDISSVNTVADVAALNAGNVTTTDFTAAVAGFADARNLNGGAKDLEPEYITVKADGTKAFVSLQENNAIAVYDITTMTFDEIQSLGTIDQTVDASDRDGPGGDPSIKIDDTIPGLPMPDAIDTYTVNGTTYYVTANEGDGRGEIEENQVSLGQNFDELRLKNAGDTEQDADGVNATNPDLAPGFAGDTSDAGLGRLVISAIDGLNGLGEIETPTMFGTRSFSIWDETGTLVFDSGSDFEQITADQIPALFNSDENDTGKFDKRSDNKGPEPEGVVIGEMLGRIFAFVGLERVGGVMVYDITDPVNSTFIDYINTGAQAPEGLFFIPPSGGDPLATGTLLASFEDSNQIQAYDFDAFQVPEPTSAALILLGAAGLMRRRRPTG